jgi:repressor LexA
MLNDRAREILSFIQRFARERGYPPTIREIGKEYGISSTNGVRYYLNLLEKEGHLKRSNRISRGIEGMAKQAQRSGIPVLGRVAAGQPILAEESLDGTVEPGEMFGDRNGLFALRVRGDSMTEKIVWQMLKQYAAAAGVVGMAPHDLRRTCAKLCWAAGVELEQGGGFTTEGMDEKRELHFLQYVESTGDPQGFHSSGFYYVVPQIKEQS